MKRKMYKYLFLGLIFLFDFEDVKAYGNQINKNEFKSSKVTFIIFTNNDKSYGYDIESNGKIIIHQPHMPCLESKIGFSTKKNAEAIAKLVIAKLKLGIFPPTITQNEILKLTR